MCPFLYWDVDSLGADFFGKFSVFLILFFFLSFFFVLLFLLCHAYSQQYLILKIELAFFIEVLEATYSTQWNIRRD
jgi:hypothetical protein